MRNADKQPDDWLHRKYVRRFQRQQQQKAEKEEREKKLLEQRNLEKQIAFETRLIRQMTIERDNEITELLEATEYLSRLPSI